ncbi:class I SAM-dependent methyltransferase [bacterium]|nr:class I SAM-dependent methyltransferase [bacterium]
MCRLSGTITYSPTSSGRVIPILPEGSDVGFFNWAAPLVRLYGNRFETEDIERMALWLRPAVGPGGRILDVGGGSGQLAHLLADRLEARVTVLDPTPEMLEHVQTDEAVDAVAGVAEALPFDDDTFDAIVVTDAFHHFRDPVGAAREFARAVRHNGLVIVLDLDPSVRPIPLIAFGERLLGEPATFMTPRQMCSFMSEHGIEGECATDKGASYHFVGCVQKVAEAV